MRKKALGLPKESKKSQSQKNEEKRLVLQRNQKSLRIKK
jgi:hypothetical protein